MAKETTREIATKEVTKLNQQAKINEAYFAGLVWHDPFSTYSEYVDTLSMDEFVHDVWGFYFELGKRMYKEGIRTFDDITVHTKVKEYNVEEDFKKYGGLDTIEDAVEIVKHNSENVEYYYETIKYNYTVRQLLLIFGEKVLISKNKYQWDSMNREQLVTYWTDKVNQLNLGSVNRYEAENLYIDPEEFIRKLEEDSAEMLPFYNSYMMNSITQGLPRGAVTMFGGFGNSGKSSFTAEKFTMSCIANKEKMIVVLNEEDAQAYRQKIVLSILWHEFNTGFDRKRMVNGKLQEADKEKIRKAFKRLEELMDEKEGQIKIIFMEKYIMKDLEKIIRFWANRGYSNLLIDTHKVSDESEHEARWQTFVEDMKTIYRITRKNAGGCNLRTLTTFQLADSAIKNRYLDFDAIGEGKMAKNEASIVMMFRPIWADEYKDEKRALDCYKLKKNERTGGYDKEFFQLEKGKTYYLLFTPKNRQGANNDNGQPVLVIEPNFNANHFKEIGWTFVANDKSGR
jgi:replicative DNA helicase